jgi:lysophospholipase L1-like esterase
MEFCLRSAGRFWSIIHGTPNLRIGRRAAAGVAAAVAASCSANSPTGPAGPPAPGSTIVYTAIGASDATGHGASVECQPLGPPCPNGTGYVQTAVRQLQAQGFVVTLRNMGIPAAVIGPDFLTLEQQYNHNAAVPEDFIDHEMPFVLPNSTLVTVFAGGNEVNTITVALGGGAGGSDPAGFIDAQVRAFGADYSTLVNGIRSHAGSARIVVLNVPNLAGLPFLAGGPLNQRQAAQRAAVGMTRSVVNPLTAQGIAVVDLMCDPRTYVGSNYSSDGFHPNDSGYAFIAGEVVKAATSPAYPAPGGSCPQMTLVQ